MILIFGILVVLAAGMVAMSDASAVRCSDDRNPIQSPRGSMACVFDDTLVKLLDRGWIIPPVPDIKELYAYESCGSDDEYYTYHASKDHPYEKVIPITHSITDGEFVKLCVQPYYKWFNIHLDTDTGGSITLEIPKNKIDLKQYDYYHCKHYVAIYDSDPRYVGIAGEQVAETAESRTLKFTYDEPLSAIISFGGYSIIDGTDYSQPNYCVKKSEAQIPGRAWWSYDIHLNLECEWPLNLNYTITGGGSVDKICAEHFSHERVTSVIIHLSDVTSLGYLTVDFPWRALADQRILGLDYPGIFGAANNSDPENCLAPEIIARSKTGQTFKFPIKDTNAIQIGYVQDPASVIDLEQVIDAVKPSNRTATDKFSGTYNKDPEHVTHETIYMEPFDKRIDGKFIGRCNK